MNVFAGFWVDGAVRKPEDKHCDADGLVITRDKKTGKLCKWDIGNVEDVDFWLDTTPRESLTPEELFSVLRILWPKCEKVFNPGNDASVEWQVQLDDTNQHTPIDWGNLTQYPPSVETQWVQVTKKNLSKFILQPCRMRKGDLTYSGTVAGWHLEDDQCLVSSTYNEDDSVLQWDCVEVCVDPTS